MGINEFSPDTKTVTQFPSLLIDGNDGAVLLVNNDPNNSIYIGGDRGVSPQQRVTNTIPPLGSIALDATDGPIYGVMPVGQTAVCQIIPKGTAYAPSPVLIAQQILNSGVVIVDNPKPILTGPLTIPATPTQLVKGPFLVNTYQSWNLFFNWGGVGGATPYVEIILSWFADPNNAFLTYEEKWIVPVDNVSNYIGHGPHYGPYMSVQFSSYDNLSNTMNWQLMGSNRPINETTIRQSNTQNPPGFGTDDILLNLDQSNLGPGASTPSTPVNYYNGPVTIRFGITGATAVNTAQLFLKFQPVAVDFGNNNSVVLAGPMATGTEDDRIINMNFPRRPITASITNNQSSGNINVRCRIIAKGAVQ